MSFDHQTFMFSFIYIDIARKIWLQKKHGAVKCGFSSVKGSMAYTQTEH